MTSSNATPTYTAKTYAAGPYAGDKSDFGICLSGGGSRALTCALGQLSALTKLSGTDGFKKLLSPDSYLSTVSGGTWAAVPYIYLPDRFSDADFLISILDPGTLTFDSSGNPSNTAHMKPNCLGKVPQNLALDLQHLYLDLIEVATKIVWMYQHMENVGVGTLLELLLNLLRGENKTFIKYSSMLWVFTIGQTVLQDFGLYNPVSGNNAYPDRSFSFSPDYVRTNVLSLNPQSTLTTDSFYFCRGGRPKHIANFNLMDGNKDQSPLVPAQATPYSTGIPGKSADGKIVNPGMTESFAFGSTLSGRPSTDLASIAFDRFISLCDITACSSVFYAATILRNLPQDVKDKTAAAIKAKLDELGFKDSILIANMLTAIFFGGLVDLKNFFVPRYNYWQARGDMANNVCEFDDGGAFENAGLLGLLAQTNATRALVFDNTDLAITKYGDGAQIPKSLPNMFGLHFDDQTKKYVPYAPGDDFLHAKIFDNANGDFDAIVNDLVMHSTGSTGKAADLGTAPAWWRRTLTTVRNDVAAIAAGRKVDILWVCNARVNQWQNQIKDPHLLGDLAAGQSPTPSGPLKAFPYYSTYDVGLSAEAVNLLAQQSGWVVNTLSGQIKDLLK